MPKKLNKNDISLLDELGGGLTEEARTELERLWIKRVDYPTVNEVTLPILVEYVATATEIKNLLFDISGVSESEDEDAYDRHLDRITKLQKIQLNYAKMLKIDIPVVEKSQNKFADLLLGGK